ncbi:threonylcarbamoyl-AMP synthase [Ciceribacter sp. L1K23]|uniref:L-threonylcarbamoyladenylate synthase n=1 Tax=Ciceribacter sp. L1K23 TaxID=2820276 RepID=UPI001B83D97A|nr:L-threonylcarbamoyladenylate synthase [Ciceribacter sp. L1K23]MBR0556747.1 threonylcarbamoyl-AMP synthase [Ciceribacter sp. L1K23]
MAKLIPIEQQSDVALTEALTLLVAGHPVALPTETVYGLAADATNPKAIAAIYETKGRPQFNPLICHMADLAMAERHAVFDPVSRRLAEHFWPGPLTLVLSIRDGSAIHPLATAGLDTVGIRVPLGFMRRLISAFGRPLAAPSANLSGRISPTTARHVNEDIGDRIDLILDDGASRVGVESTIVKVEDGRIRLLRPGGVAVEDIETVTGIKVDRPQSAGAAIEAPGMLASHYAPAARMRLDVTDVSPDEALITFGDVTVAGADRASAVLNLSPSGDLREAAANLFDFMKRADAAGARTIAVAPIPMAGLGEAINDRLARAAAPRDS